MRIIAGVAKGRPLLGPKGASPIRPTADRVRQAIFDILGQWMDGQDVLDLYAGTGAMALEALSRGAASAVMVDSNRGAAALCRDNLARLGFGHRAEVILTPVEEAIASLGGDGRKFHLVFADPPYAQGAAGVTQMVSKARLLAPAGTFCVEHGKRESLDQQIGSLRCKETRRFGDTSVSLFVNA